MNRYIKKCLIVYTSLALVLVGMAGAAYAITATDADNYVTRSQYAVDMAYLQNKLDEQEAGLMGSINRFRSTDVKFVTFDTPNKYVTSGATRGYHNGGNHFMRPFGGTSTVTQNPWGIATNGGSMQEGKNPLAATMSIYRLYNGNYFVSQNLGYNIEESTNNYVYVSGVNYAVPAENLPGWYLVIYARNLNANGINAGRMALVKLDPTVSFPTTNAEAAAIENTYLRFRFKKDLFMLARDNNTGIFTPTKVAGSVNHARYVNISQCYPFSRTHITNVIATDNVVLNYVRWLDEETGDFMQEIRGLTPNWPTENPTNASYVTYLFSRTDNTGFSNIIPRDNVEYVSGANCYFENYSPGGGLPSATHLGTGTQADACWRHEIVDGINGIKYYHGYRFPETVARSGYSIYSFATHYSLPIVY